MKQSLFLVVISVILVLVSCGKSDEQEDVLQNSDFTIDSVSLDDYTNIEGDIVFNTAVLLTNNTQEDKFVSIKGDFETEYKVGMIETQILEGFDTETGFKIFLIPADSQIMFDVSFSTKGKDGMKKPDRLAPEIIIEEVAESEVNTSEVVTNIATKSDGTIIIPK
ncbi:MAG: hypothetical protein IKJ86_05440 [Clostridia bacterium]|nr:hypothetical protein [Clostridia bacterium]